MIESVLDVSLKELTMFFLCSILESKYSSFYIRNLYHVMPCRNNYKMIDWK